MQINAVVLIISISLLLLCLCSLYINFTPKRELTIESARYDYAYQPITFNKNKNMNTSYLFKNLIQSIHPSKYSHDIALKMQNTFGVNHSVWGLKKVGNNYNYEFYIYYRHLYPMHTIENLLSLFGKKMKHKIPGEDYYLLSFDTPKIKDETGHNPDPTEINVYYGHIGCKHVNDQVLWKGFYKLCKFCKNTKNISLNIDTGIITPKNVYVGILMDEDSPFERTIKTVRDFSIEKFAKEPDYELIVPQYLMKCKKSVCIGIKPDSIGIYFSLITIDDFIQFLKQHQFTEALINHMIANKNNVYQYTLFDVAYNFKIKDGKTVITKSSFCGII